MKLEGKVAVVTGASKGIGAQIAKDLAEVGAKVVVNYRSDVAGADEVVEAIRSSGGSAVAIQADVRRPVEVDRLFAETLEQIGAPSVLVNNAGIYRFAPLEAVTEGDYRDQFDANVLSVLLTTKAFAACVEGEGSVINVTTAGVHTNPPMSAVYVASKAAVLSITRVLARELGGRRIRVNAIAPGVTETDGLRALGFMGTEMEKHAVASTALGRLGRVRDIAPVAVFLASDESRWITGEVLVASGGMR